MWQNVLGIAALVIAIGSVSLVGLMRERLANLGKSVEEFRERVSDLEGDRTRLEAENAAAQSENRVLKALVTGKVEWTAISDQLTDVLKALLSGKLEWAEIAERLDAHHIEALKQWSGMNKRLEQIHTDLTERK